MPSDHASSDLFTRLKGSQRFVWIIITDIFKERVSRQTIWLNLLIIAASFLVCLIVLSVFDDGAENDWWIALAIVPMLHLVAVAILGHVGRLHDANHSGWWWFIHWIPGVGSLLVWLFVLFAEGDKTDNRYGSPPPDRLHLSSNPSGEINSTLSGGSEPNPRAWIMAVLAVSLLWILGASLFGDREGKSGAPRQIAQYQGFTISEAFKDAYAYAGEGGTPSFYAEYSGELDSLIFEMSVRTQSSCEKNSEIEVAYAMRGDLNGSSYVETRMTSEIAEALDGSYFRQKDTASVGRINASSGQLMSLLDSSEEEFVGERSDVGTSVTRFRGGKKERRLLPAETLIMDSVKSYEKSLIAEGKREGGYSLFDSTAEDWHLEMVVSAQPIFLDDEYNLWEFNDGDSKFLVTKEGLEVWGQIPLDEGDLTLTLGSFEPLRDSPCGA